MSCSFLKFGVRPYFFSSFAFENSKADIFQTKYFPSGSLWKSQAKM